jgi:predicted nucleic acid-binding protein
MQQGEAVTSIVVYGEVLEYLLKRYAHRPQLQQDLKMFLQTDVKPLSITQRVMERYAQIRIALRNTQGPQGQRLGLIGDADTLIAATAMVHNLTLVTADTDPLLFPILPLGIFLPANFVKPLDIF